MNQSNKRVLLVGGGSGGPVAPLLAVVAELKKQNSGIDFLFVGTDNGPEKKMVEDAGLKFVSIRAAKFRRYFSLSNFTDIFVFIQSLFKARKLLKEVQPDLIFSAGGFSAVPICWMARNMKIKIMIHQQDAEVGLANRLVAPMASIITTAFERTTKDFVSASGLASSALKPVAEWVGNPVRPEFFTPVNPLTKQKLGLNDELPVLFVVGGATGAVQLNEIIDECIDELVKTHQVIHITGVGKNYSTFKHQNYHPFEFLSQEYPDTFKLADIVICRAGLSTIAELSASEKIAIVVPMPGTHQEANAAILKERNAAVVLDKFEFNPEDLPRIVTSLKFNVARIALLKENIKNIMPHDAASRIAKLISENV